jgi:hypothetical protein
MNPPGWSIGLVLGLASTIVLGFLSVCMDVWPLRRGEGSVFCIGATFSAPPRLGCARVNIYKEPVRTSQETHYVIATEPNRLMLFRETDTVYCENHTELQTGSGAHPVSYPISTGGSFLGGKAAGT